MATIPQHEDSVSTTRSKRHGDRHRNRHGGDRHKTVRHGDRHKHATPLTQTPYLCIDGEATGGTYTLLASSDGSEIYNPKGLTTSQIFEWLITRSEREFWCFAGNYDVNNWLESFTRTELERLSKSRHNRCYWYEWVVTHYYSKFFQLTKRERCLDDEGNAYWKNLKTIRIWDMFSFVGSSFVSMVDKWKLCRSDAERNWLAEMKSKRGEFTESSIDEIRRYNQLELKLLHDGVAKLKSMCDETGYIPKAWYSPGSVASSAFAKYDVAFHIARDEIPPEINRIASEAYYGGRFEVSRLGQIDGPLHHYDIRSAYPAAMTTLPSLAKGQWIHTTGKRSRLFGDGFALIEWHTNKASAYGPLPVRLGNSSLRYPLHSKQAGWYALREVRAAMSYADVTVKESYVLEPDNDVKPFDYLRALYQQRLEYKSAKDSREHVIKLIINSSYGKLAQTSKTYMVDGEMSIDIPRWQSLIYASWITADTRSKLLMCIAQKPLDIVFLATDGLVSEEPIDVAIGGELGEWEYERLRWLFVVQSGVYFWPETKENNEVVIQHSRGIGHGKLDYQHVLASWCKYEPINVIERHFIGYKTALQRDMALWRTWLDEEKSLVMTTEPRRKDTRRYGSILHSKPLQYADDTILQTLHDTRLDDIRRDNILLDEQPEPLDGNDL